MKAKLFFMSVLAIAILIFVSCGNGSKENGGVTGTEKGVATYNFSDGTTITKSKNGEYKSNVGTVDQVNGDIIVIRIPNVGHEDDIDLKNAKYFSVVYNVNSPDPIVTADDYCVLVSIYPKSGYIMASKAGRPTRVTPRYTLRTFDGYAFLFPSVDEQRHLFYKKWSMEDLKVDDDAGKIIMALPYGTHSFSRSDIKPDWIKGKDIYLDFKWYFDRSKTYIKPAKIYIVN
jgi:hypothetical protein